MEGTIIKVLKSRWLIAISCLIIGALFILVIRVAAYSPPKGVHYHANLAVYINGQREEFRALNYYEEEAATTCSTAETVHIEASPMSRVHMHDNVDDVVHVEDTRVTWGNFFTVLGWNVGATYLATRDALYQTNTQSRITYILNGKEVANIANTVINDQDRLLVNYGSQSQSQLNQEYAQIKNDALAADRSKDPAGCGSNHDASTSMAERMRHMF